MIPENDMTQDEHNHWEHQVWLKKHEQEHRDRGETLVPSLNRFEITVDSFPYDDPDGYEFERASGFGGEILQVEYRCTVCGRNVLYWEG